MKGETGEERVRLEHPAAVSLPDRRKLDGTRSAHLPGELNQPSLFGVTQKDT